MNLNLVAVRAQLRSLDWLTWALWVLAETLTGAFSALINRPEMSGWNLLPGLLPALVLLVRCGLIGWLWPIVTAVGLYSNLLIYIFPWIAESMLRLTLFLDAHISPLTLTQPGAVLWLFIGLAQALLLRGAHIVGWRGMLIWTLLTTFNQSLAFTLLHLLFIPLVIDPYLVVFNAEWGFGYGLIMGAFLAWTLRGRRMPREMLSNQPPPRKRTLRRVIVR